MKHIIILLCIVLASCKAYDVKQTKPLTLQEGIVDIFEALDAAGNLEMAKQNGLVPSEFTIELNLSTSEKGTQNASLEIAPATVVPKIGSGWSAEVNNTTGNKLTITFKSVLFAKKDDFIASKSADELMEYIERLKALGFSINVQ
jgi:hypothetical protein